MAKSDVQIPSVHEVVGNITSDYRELPLSLIDTNPSQPREHFDEGKIDELSQSIKGNMLIQVPTVRPHPTIPGRYMIVAGERRFHALVRNGVEKHVVKVIDGPGVAKSYILSAIENIVRVDLNPIEEAKTYQRLHDEEHLTWEQVSALLGKDISVMLNKIKLLDFPLEIQEKIKTGQIPQATVLNLSQWQNDEGAYFRMAHDLIAGRNPAEAHFRRQTTRGQIHIQARLPKNALDFGVRIVKVSTSIRSVPAVLEAFLVLSADEQNEAFASISPTVRASLRGRFRELFRATQAFSELFDKYDAVEPTTRTSAPASLSSAPTIVPLPTEVKSQGEVPKPPIAPAPSAVQTPTAPPVTSASSTEMAVQSLKLSGLVLRAILYASNNTSRPAVNLSRRRLEALKSGMAGAEKFSADQLVANAFAEAKKRWREKLDPRSEEEIQKFMRFLHQMRRHFGESPDFAVASALIRQIDDSEDPLRVPMS